MAITYTWTIAQLERNTSDGGVTVAHWRVSAVDGDYTASAEVASSNIVRYSTANYSGALTDGYLVPIEIRVYP